MTTCVTIQFNIKDLEIDTEEDGEQAVLDYLFEEGFPSEVVDDLEIEVVSWWNTEESEDDES